MFREFMNVENEDWTELEPHERAWTSCTSPYLAMCCGRGVRKTTTMIEMLYYWMINRMHIPGDPGLLAFVPGQAHKNAVLPRIIDACTQHWLISKFVKSINRQEGRIDFTNGFTFIMRIAGAEGKETNVTAVHGARIWVDEAQDFPWKAWQSLDNILKFDIPWHMLWVSGVPNGERKNNVLYSCDVEDEKYISFNIAQTMMSWWNADLEYQRRKRYKALQEDSEDYKHYVLGQHGVPTFAVFDRTRFLKEDYETVYTEFNQAAYEKTRRDGEYHINELLVCPPPPSDFNLTPKLALGYDVGYSPDPAIFFIMYQDVKSGVWRNLLRIKLSRVEYALQRETFLYLDTVYNFDVMGIDMGGPGKVVYQEITTDLAPISYTKRRFKERIYPVEFGGKMVVALQDEKDETIEKKDNIKRVAVETVSRWVHEHRFSFDSTDDSLMDELERTKFTRTPMGEPVYKTDDDHQFAAMMCAVMAWEHFYGEPLGFAKVEIKPKLLTAKWLQAN